MKKKALSLVLALALCLGLAVPALAAGTTFSDVKTSDFYYDAVNWAVANGITNGTSAGKFSPNDTCTQAQILTFLWRAMGSPEPAGTASMNIDAGKFYYKAALWAKEQGLIDNSFSADTPCTRAMAVTYLWKLAGSPSAGTPNFDDVASSASYAPAVAWAVAQGVTNGTGNGKFSPDAVCTRGQIVTFLYRALYRAPVDLNVGEYQEGGDYGYLGDVMNTYWFNFTVDEAYICDSLGGYTAAEGKQLLVVHLAMLNTSRSTLTMYDTDFQAQWNDADSQAYAWPVSTLDEEYLWNNQPHIDKQLVSDQLPAEYDIAVNSTVDGLLVYEVPAALPDGSANRDFSISFQEVFANNSMGDVYFLYFTAEDQTAAAPSTPSTPSTSQSVNLDSGEYREGGDWGYLGDVMNTYWFNFTVDEAYTCASLGGYTAAEGKQLLVVHLALKNTTRDTQTMYDTDFQAQWNDDDSQAYAWPVSTLDEEYLWNNQPHVDKQLASDQLPAEYNVPVGGTVDGLLVYEVPATLPDGTANRDFSISFQEVFSGAELGDVYFLYFTAEAR